MRNNPFKLALLFSIALLAVLFTIAASAAEAARPLPGESVYQLDFPVTDQLGISSPWASARGKVQVVSMFYTSCRYVCPLLVDTLKRVENSIPEAQRRGLQLRLISFDPARDDVAALASVATKRKLDPARWRLLRTSADHVRELAAVLDIQYRQLEDGEFNHASRIVLLDPDGRILASSEKLGSADPPFVAATMEALDRANQSGSVDTVR
ncbi:MAG: SCO family protein [Tahibacter sp.]